MRLVLALAAALVAGATASDHRVGSAGVSVRLPPGWHSLQRLGGLEPKERLVVSSRTIPIRSSQCQVASYAPRRGAVTIVVLEWVAPVEKIRSPPRPRRFTRKNLPLRRGILECYGGFGGSVSFDAHGRHLAAYLMLDRHAPPGLADRARRVLDTLRVARR
jgi:hypothetical protein